MGPAFDALDDAVHEGRRAFRRGRHIAEDASAAATRTIRRQPLGAVAIAAGAGALVGALIGFSYAAFCRK